MLRVCLLSVLAVTAAHGSASRLSKMGLGGDSGEPKDGATCPAEDGYKKGRKLGQGQSAAVYQYKKGKRKFAGKRAHDKQSARDDVWKESKMLQNLQNIGVADVPIFVDCYGNKDTNVELFMNVAPGCDLAQIRNITKEQADEILGSIATVVASIHANKIVHCDLHGENVKVDINRRKNTIKTTVIDWAGCKTFGKTNLKKDAKQFATMASHTFEKAGDAEEELEEARRAMTNTSRAFDLLHKYSNVHVWQQDGDLWKPIYGASEDDLSGWRHVETTEVTKGARYNIYEQGGETRKVWVPST